jgi:copper oxidase (laccase) domain-containing protein
MLTIEKTADGSRLAFFKKLASQHLITTIDHGDTKPDLLAYNGPSIQFAKTALGTNRIIVADVQHESKITLLNKNEKNQVIQTDGLLYIHYHGDTTPALILAATTGDCPYLLLEARNTHFSFASLVHCGRMGISDKIIPKTMDNIQKLGVKAGQVRVGLWTGICQACYEVGPEVLKTMRGYCHPPFFIKNKKKDTWQLDLASIIRKQLEQYGIWPSQIEESGVCSYCYLDSNHKPVFYSRRRAFHQNQQDLEKRNGIFMRLSA